MRVKICGLTRAEDALRAEKLGAWALGFILYRKSKRFIAPVAAADIFFDLDKRTKKIGVFVNQTAEALDLAKKLGLSGLQLHGDETPEDCAAVRKSFDGLVIKAFRPRTAEDLAVLSAYKGVIDYALLDTAPEGNAEGEYGGSGRTGDWDLAASAAGLGPPLILAGGLTPRNILAACEKVRPFAADLSSGVEASPGIKDVEKLEALFDAVEGV